MFALRLFKQESLCCPIKGENCFRTWIAWVCLRDAIFSGRIQQPQKKLVSFPTYEGCNLRCKANVTSGYVFLFNMEDGRKHMITKTISAWPECAEMSHIVRNPAEAKINML